MRAWLLGTLVGAVLMLIVGFLAGWFDLGAREYAADSESGNLSLAPQTAERESGTPHLGGPALDSPQRVGPRRGPDAQPPAFESGQAWLTIGDGYVFGEPGVRRGEDRDHYDLYCQDIRHGVSLACPHGAGEARAPLSAVGMPESPEMVAALMKDAPVDLPGRNLWLLSRSTVQRPGIGVARGRDGVVYKLHLLKLEPHPEALRRRVLIRYEAVPTREAGGELHLLATAEGKPVPVAVRPAIRHALEYRRKLRHASFIGQLEGPYEVISALAPETVLTRERYLLLDAPLQTKIVIPHRGAVFASKGIDPDGVVVLNSYAAVGTVGDMAGEVDIQSYGYLHIAGDLVGTVKVGSYATVIIEGDLRGTLRVRSYTTLLLRGRVLGTLDCKGSCWSTFYLDGFWSQAELEQFGDGFRSITLHVRDSDLAHGKHKKIGSWREVIVGDKVWEKLAQ